MLINHINPTIAVMAQKAKKTLNPGGGGIFPGRCVDVKNKVGETANKPIIGDVTIATRNKRFKIAPSIILFI